MAQVYFEWSCFCYEPKPDPSSLSPNLFRALEADLSGRAGNEVVDDEEADDDGHHGDGVHQPQPSDHREVHRDGQRRGSIWKEDNNFFMWPGFEASLVIYLIEPSSPCLLKG